MNKRNITPFAGIAVAAGIAGLVALAGSYHGLALGGLRIFALCAIGSFAIQWLAFIPAYLLRTEKFFDLTGSLTYISLVVFAVVAAGNWEPRSLVLAALLLAWSVRLGSFLFSRVLQSGGDARFEMMKSHLPSFLLTWTLQGLWVFLTASAALAAISSNDPAAMDWTVFAGVAIWVAGFAIEVAADAQKQRFRSDPANRGRFIRSGLWAWSRHPNYFGEIVIWIGVAVVAAPSLSGWQWVTMVSPVFVTLLLTRISGIPLLERRGKQRWGNHPGYQEYLACTPVLVPRPPACARR
jgi:steroid 5-alpha reductase family enzyme